MMHLNSNYQKIAFLSCLIFLIPLVSLGTDVDDLTSADTDILSSDSSFSIDNPLKYDTLDKFITAIMGLVLQIMTPVIAILIIWTGFLFVKARGNPAEITKAKQAFLWVIIGAAIMLGAFVLKAAIEGTVDQLGDGSVIFTILQPYV